LEKHRVGIYCALQTFFVGEPFGVRRCLLKNPVAVIHCDCFQTFVERENFFEKDTDRFLAKILFGVSYNTIYDSDKRTEKIMKMMFFF
jgi:hypothetical protein